MSQGISNLKKIDSGGLVRQVKGNIVDNIVISLHGGRLLQFVR